MFSFRYAIFVLTMQSFMQCMRVIKCHKNYVLMLHYNLYYCMLKLFLPRFNAIFYSHFKAIIFLMRYVQNANWESDLFFEDIICDQKPHLVSCMKVLRPWRKHCRHPPPPSKNQFCTLLPKSSNKTCPFQDKRFLKSSFPILTANITQKLFA